MRCSLAILRCHRKPWPQAPPPAMRCLRPKIEALPGLTAGDPDPGAPLGTPRSRPCRPNGRRSLGPVGPWNGAPPWTTGPARPTCPQRFFVRLVPAGCNEVGMPVNGMLRARRAPNRCRNPGPTTDFESCAIEECVVSVVCAQSFSRRCRGLARY